MADAASVGESNSILERSARVKIGADRPLIAQATTNLRIKAMKVFQSTLLIAAIATTFAGCDTSPKTRYDLVDLVKAGGKVTLDGKALPDAVVTFDDPADDTFSYAKTDGDGNYTLQFDSEMSGVKTGKKVVRISTTRKLLALAAAPGAEEGADPDAKSKDKELVPEKYNKKSELSIEVTSDKTQYDFELKSNG